MRKTGVIIVMLCLLSGCFGKKYNVDYEGCKDLFIGAKDSFQKGAKVKLVYNLIATDTDYHFEVIGAKYEVDYNEKEGYVITFIMPDNDVSIEVTSKNSMEYHE